MTGAEGFWQIVKNRKPDPPNDPPNLECGIGQVPYWMDRMDEEWEKRRSEAPLLRAKPSEYMRRGNWFYAAEPEENTLPYVMERIGEDAILFASDYPHWDGNFPHMVSTVRGRKDISDGQKDKIMRANAIRLYGWNGQPRDSEPLNFKSRRRTDSSAESNLRSARLV